MHSIFFGGGTPSLNGAGDLEVTLEAKPTSSEAEGFRVLRVADFHRIPLGVRALGDAALRFLGREHSAAEALAAVDLAARLLARFSIYGPLTVRSTSAHARRTSRLHTSRSGSRRSGSPWMTKVSPPTVS